MSLKNLLNKLIKEGKLRRQDTGIDYLNNLLEAARRNFEAATIVKGKVDEEFWSKAKTYLQKRNPQLKLFKEF